MKYCSLCGAEVELKIPEGDDRNRYVCPACEAIHYQNPNIVAGCIPIWNGEILLCKRAIEPRYALWTLPAGFMEMGETTVEAAQRETLEEARARVSIEGLYVILNLPSVNQVYMMFRSRLLDTDFGPGHESLEVRLYKEEEVPWDQIAFPTIQHTLKLYFEDRRRGTYPLHIGDIVRQEGGYCYRPGPGSGQAAADG